MSAERYGEAWQCGRRRGATVYALSDLPGTNLTQSQSVCKQNAECGRAGGAGYESLFEMVAKMVQMMSCVILPGMAENEQVEVTPGRWYGAQSRNVSKQR